MKLLVITLVPDPLGPDAIGNLAAPLGELYMVEPGLSIRHDNMQPATPLERLNPALALSLRKTVFSTGEILIVDEDGREIGGAFRKPEKWGVHFDTFGLEEIEAAIALARTVCLPEVEATTT